MGVVKFTAPHMGEVKSYSQPGVGIVY